VVALIHALEKPESTEVEEAIAQALQRIMAAQDSEEAELEVLRQTVRVSHVAVVAASVRHLGQLTTTDVLPPLIDALHATASEIRYEAIVALGAKGDLRALPALLQFINRASGGEREIAADAAKALVRVACGQVPSDVDLLAKALNSAHAEVAAEAARVLGVLGDPRSVAALEWACLRGVGLLSEAAGKALGRIGGLESLRRLTKVLSEGDDRMAAGAQEALVAVGAPAVTPLCKALKWKYARARLYAAQALGRIGDESVAALLRSATRDRDPSVRDAAAVALRQLEMKRQLRCLK
jgi:HEAT repeat protein